MEVTFDMIRSSPEIRTYITQADASLTALGFTEHSFAHVGKLWGDRIFEKCGIRRDEEGDGGKTPEIRGKRRLSARDGGANYQQS